MGNSVGSKAAPPIHDMVASLQSQLCASRRQDCSTVLPRSTMVDGRYVLSQKHFPEISEYSSLSDLIRWKTEAEPHPSYSDEFLDKELPVISPSKQKLTEGAAAGTIQATWLGHASVLVQFNGWNVIVDPIFSERCSPSQWFGPSRLRPSPVKDNLNVLPHLDMCCISHNHYDHLDLNSITALSSAFPDMVYCVPLGMKEWLIDSGVQNPILEMDWSESATINDTSSESRCSVTVHCIPCQHWCARGRLDRNKCLWCAWCVSTAHGSFFFGGDTGYCPLIFKQVPKFMGGSRISLAALPIGAYGSDGEKWFHKYCHMNPNEAVLTHKDITAKVYSPFTYYTTYFTNRVVHDRHR